MSTVRRHLLVITLGWFLGAAGGSQAATYYVATTGLNSRSCTTAQTITTPKLTIASGMTCLSAGDTLSLRGGTYAEQITPATMTLPAGTSWATPVTIAGYPSEVVTLANGIIIQDNLNSSIVSYLIFDNLTVRNPAMAPALNIAGNSHHIRISSSDLQGGGNTIMISNTTAYNEVINCQVHDSPVAFDNGMTTGHYGFYVGGNHNLYDGNRVYNNTGYGFSIYQSGQSTVSDNIVRNNIVYGNGFDDGQRGQGSSAMLLASGGNNIAYNNIIYGNTGPGITTAYRLGTINDQIYNNTVYGNTGFGIEIGTDAPQTIVRNNIAYANASGAPNEQIVDFGATGTVQSNNVTTNPQFVNAAANDFRLQAGSPAIDAGFSLSGVVLTDIVGVTRPQGAAYDIGAYEFTSVAPVLAAPTNLRIVAH